jgi:serine phosphatase RsbU (regulator of sigma subunit)
MESKDQFQQNPEDDAQDEVLKYAYRLDTLFDISRSLLATFDPEVILNTCLLSTMGNFGVVKGFIVTFDLPSREVVHLVSQGIQDGEVNGLQLAVVERLNDNRFAPSHAIGGESHDFLPPLAGMECMLAFMVDPDHFGWMGIGPKILGGLYSPDEKQLLVTLKNSLVVALKNARSFDEIKRLNADLVDKKTQLERTVKELQAAMIRVADYSRHLEKIIAALNVAQEVQQNLLPQGPPVGKRFDIAGATLYCDETGGDYYDYVELPGLGPDAYGLVVGDVSGHGISSALLMAGVRAYLRGRAGQPGSVAEIIMDVNRLVAADTANTYQFMTLLLVAIDPRTDRLTWVNAGHDPALVYDPASDCFEELRGRGLALGVNEECRYTEHSAIAQPGQIVILTTDGVFEAHDLQGKLFGRERLKQVIRKSAGLKAEDILKAVVEAVGVFRGEAAQNDDITLVVAKYSGE